MTVPDAGRVDVGVDLGPQPGDVAVTVEVGPQRWVHHPAGAVTVFEQVAARSGFGSAALLRHHFTRQVGVPPADDRRTFACAG